MFKNIATVVGCILTCITFVTLLCKPLRNKFIEWIRKTSNISESEKAIKELRKNFDEMNQTIRQHLEDSTQFRKEIKDQFDNLNQEISRLTGNDVLVLRDRILEIYFKAKERGYMEDRERETMAALHNQYVQEGGNSYEHVIYTEGMALPSRPNE